MNISKANYPRYADARAPKSALVRDCLRAFVCGGIICAIGEGLNKLYVYAGLERDMAGLLCSVTLVFAAVLLTGLGVFDRIARFAGAGTLVPITGFANAVCWESVQKYLPLPGRYCSTAHWRARFTGLFIILLGCSERPH